MLLVLAAFVVLFGWQRFGARGIAAGAMIAVLLSAAAWVSSPYVRARVLGTLEQIHDYRTKQAETSAGYRLEFWRKSIEIISRAPIAGHGTGSLYQQFRLAAEGDQGIAAAVTNNPHNQTLVVAIQLGFLGVVLLYAMWLSHLLLFRGDGLIAWIGSAVVLHNIGGGLFNSQLFEATLGWVYIFGVGVLGGMALRARENRHKDADA
jgi:O-antigen ligase